MSELVPYTGGQLAPTSSTPATTGGGQITINQPAAGGGSNWRIVALFSILALAAITLWRIKTGRATGTPVKTVWSAVVLAILISLLADLNSGLGAAFGGSVLLFLLIKDTGITAAAGSAVASSGSSGGPATPPSLPRGVTATPGALGAPQRPPGLYLPGGQPAPSMVN